ncbi:hypothetical protein QE152_g13169 [Popillia japonica]|uniref:Uncharacterized protein n=1 Tax=Popillia japonica TaxID=7064 RepID=A0AAW1LFH4_POPJA
MSPDFERFEIKIVDQWISRNSADTAARLVDAFDCSTVEERTTRTEFCIKSFVCNGHLAAFPLDLIVRPSKKELHGRNFVLKVLSATFIRINQIIIVIRTKCRKHRQ